MKKSVILGLTALAGVAQADVQLYNFATLDISGLTGIGNNPSAIAWNGSDLYVGGYNNSGGTANTGIARVQWALSGSPATSTFGVFSTANARGVTGLAWKNGKLAAALDNGAGSGDSVRAFDAAGNLAWRIGTSASDSTRRGDGVAFDPGFNGAGPNQGVAYLSIGSGRRHLLDANTGAYINGQNAGAIINFAPVATTWRDLVFDSATGDLYTREANRIGKAVRNGDNSFTGGASTVLAALTTASAVDNQNIEFMNLSGNKFVIANDRSSVGGGQSFASVIKMFSTAGVAETINWNGFAAATGNGAYDFSYDAGSQTLAVSDFANRKVYFFAVPAPSAAVLLGMAGVMAGRRRR